MTATSYASCIGLVAVQWSLLMQSASAALVSLSDEGRAHMESVRARRLAPITVPDLIGLNRPGSGNVGGYLESKDGVKSPDGAYYATVSQRGELTTNTRKYSLLLFKANNGSYQLNSENPLSL